MNEFVLMTYYVKYLKEIRKVSDSSVRHYRDALRYISKYLVQKEKIKKSVYEIQDIGELEVIRAYLYSDADFVALDKRGHQMYSAGFNNYYKFACGEGFTNIHKQIELLDTQVPMGTKTTSTTTSWRRSSIIKIQSIEFAGYQCEVNANHTTFTAKSSGQQYMEGHHILPMKIQNKFSNSLDVYANIICLCPICHRMLHYGIESEKDGVLDKIYYDRADRLASNGLAIGKSDFKTLAV